MTTRIDTAGIAQLLGVTRRPRQSYLSGRLA